MMWTIMYVASGEGITKCGGKENTVGEGCVIFAPKGIEHTVNNTGDKKLRLVCFYVPPMELRGNFKEATEKTRRFFERLSHKSEGNIKENPRVYPAD